MLLLQGQLQVEETDLEKLQSFGDFVAIFYSSLWFQSPFASEAAYNDLVLQNNVEISEFFKTWQYCTQRC